ncbi:MAG: tetratricopeptide repeat protein, partial [Anaerolineales bacterium]
MHRAALGVLAGLLLAALACSLPLGAASTPTPVPTLTPSPVPSSTPSPTPAPALRNEAARSALANGDWDLAGREFERVIAESDDPIVIGEALFGRGEALLRDEQLAEAERAFSEFLSSYPDHPRLPAALILRAQTNSLLGNNEAAAADYESYMAERSGVIDLYVNEWLGDALRRASRPLEAVPNYEAALLSAGQANILGLRIKIGRAYLEAGDYAQALEQFDQVYAQSSDAATRAAMNLLAGEALEAQGDLDG